MKETEERAKARAGAAEPKVVNMEAVADVEIPWQEMEAIAKVARTIRDGEAVFVWKVVVYREGNTVRVTPQVIVECPKCKKVPRFYKDGRKGCHVVWCEHCGARVEAPTAVEAVYDWNQRVEMEFAAIGEHPADEPPSLTEVSVERVKHVADVLGTAARFIELAHGGEFNGEAEWQRLRLAGAEAALREELCIVDGDLGAASDWHDAGEGAHETAKLYESGSHADFRLCAQYHLTPAELERIRKDPSAYIRRIREDGRFDKAHLRRAVYMLDDMGVEVDWKWREEADAPKKPVSPDAGWKRALVEEIRKAAGRVQEMNKWRRSVSPYDAPGSMPSSATQHGIDLDLLAETAMMHASRIERGME